MADETTKRIEEFEALHAASVERSADVLRGGGIDLRVIDRLRAARGPVGDALRKAEAELADLLREMDAGGGSARVNSSGLGGGRGLTLDDFPYRTMRR